MSSEPDSRPPAIRAEGYAVKALHLSEDVRRLLETAASTFAEAEDGEHGVWADQLREEASTLRGRIDLLAQDLEAARELHDAEDQGLEPEFLAWAKNRRCGGVDLLRCGPEVIEKLRREWRDATP